MEIDQFLSDFIYSQQSAQINLTDFVVSIALSILLSYILSLVYVKFGRSLSNRKMFAKNFILMAAIITLIITIVKSSLALSLGLVGALSIVRYRTAIKEPEELVYLFFAIAIGLGMGANQVVLTVVAFVIIVLAILMNSIFRKKEDRQNLHLTISASKPREITMEQIVEILQKNCSDINLKRLDESEGLLETSFLVEFKDLQKLKAATRDLRSIHDSVKVTFLDNKGITY